MYYIFLLKIFKEFYNNFIKDNRYIWIFEGLKNTLLITVLSIIIGIIFGIFIAIICFYYNKNNVLFFNILKLLSKIYLIIIRGTPLMIQLLIINFVIFVNSHINLIIISSISFGINSSAYIAEIIRSGMISINKEQFDAGYSLGFNYYQIMKFIIIPQALQNILPALINEIITVLKETSIVGYIGILDLTKSAMLIQSRTYNAFLPLLTISCIYLLLTIILTIYVNELEKEFNKYE